LTGEYLLLRHIGLIGGRFGSVLILLSAFASIRSELRHPPHLHWTDRHNNLLRVLVHKYLLVHLASRFHKEVTIRRLSRDNKLDSQHLSFASLRALPVVARRFDSLECGTAVLHLCCG
jgi:hypothetical protein